jgi:NitT/TauT family transport system ATP-binding protein
MLKISNVSKNYLKNEYVVNNFSLCINNGDFVSLIGPNGSGKSTLLNIISGLETSTTGSITQNGRNLNKLDIGYIFQNYRSTLLPWKRIIDNIALPLQFRGMNKEIRHKKVLSLLSEVSVELDVKKYPYQVSGGQQQLITILQNLIYEPKLLLMDESFSSLDVSISLEVQNILQKLWLERKTTVISISHDIDESIYLANRIIILKPKPLRIAFDINIPLGYPRSNDTLISKSYSTLRETVQKSFLQVLKG